MVTNKKSSYAMKVLQLALALSLLHVDPDNYLQELQLGNWEADLEFGNGNGWELEMLRAVPLVEYPYANRKAMMPLIEDLVRFDREITSHHHDVTAYLLNVQNDSANQTAALQDLQALPTTNNPPVPAATNVGSVTIVTGPNSGNGSGEISSLEQSLPSPLSPNSDMNIFGLFPPDHSSLLNSDGLEDSRPLWEQNLADLSDFAEMPGMEQYTNLPLKNIQLESFIDVNVEGFLSGFLPTPESPSLEGAVALNGTFPNPSGVSFIKVEKSDEDDYIKENKSLLDEAAACSSQNFKECTIKKEEESNESTDLPLIDLSPFISVVELQEPKYEEKNNSNDASDNDWSGTSFTSDMETGEIIRLPLEELINDVLQLAEFSGDVEIDNDSEASTSKAAAESNNNSLFKLEEDIEADSFNKEKKNNNQGECNINNSLNDEDLPQSEIEVSSLPSPLLDLDDEAKKDLADFDKMLQSASASFHHNHHLHHHHHHAAAAAAAHRGLGGAGVQTSNYPTVGSGVNSAFQRQPSSAGYHHQGRVPLSRGVSMEQRLQDIASLFNPIPSMGVVGGVSDMPPYPHYPTHHYGYQTGPPQHAQYPPPPPHHPHGHHAMLHPNSSLGELCPSQPHYGHNLGSAVSSSMHLTNASHDSDAASSGAYKMEHDMMYYSNASSDMNHASDGFFNSILNDEDLHLMDMNVNDSFCRMVDVNSTSNNSSVLGLSTSGHGSSSSVSTGGAASLNGGVVSASNNVGMTTDLMGPGAQGGTDRLDASSDSAVSSMGSERVPSLSDGEWGEGSDSAQDYHQGKYGGPYDYSYSNANGNRLNDGSRQAPVAQKKHQMFGKRFPPAGNAENNETSSVAATQANNLLHNAAPIVKYERDPYPMMPGMPSLPQNYENSGAMGSALLKENHNGYDIKYGGGAAPLGGFSSDYGLRTPRTPQEIVQLNHTYTLPQGTGSLPRPQQRDKKLSTSSSAKSMKSGSSSNDEHLTRDEKRARSLNIPIPVDDIINLPMDEFNERLSKYDLNENQLSLIRDIRRRGKNKVAAQNCRKRKLDQIVSLEDEVKEVVRRKEQLQADRESLLAERKRISTKFSALHRHIFQYLRDADGNPCSPSEYSLQQAADGSVYLLPREQGNKTDSNSTIGAVGGGDSTSAGASSLNLNIPAMHQQQAGPPHNIHPSMMHHAHLQQQSAHHLQHQQQSLSQHQQQQQQHLQQQHHHHHHAHQHHPTQQKD